MKILTSFNPLSLQGGGGFFITARTPIIDKNIQNPYHKMKHLGRSPLTEKTMKRVLCIIANCAFDFLGLVVAILGTSLLASMFGFMGAFMGAMMDIDPIFFKPPMEHFFTVIGFCTMFLGWMGFVFFVSTKGINLRIIKERLLRETIFA